MTFKHRGKPARQPERKETPVLKRGEARGRNGEIIRREKQTSYNTFDFPEHLKDERWSYQWCRTDVYGNNEGDINEIPLMERAGWRPVRPDQLQGYFASENQGRQCIMRNGLMLMERPIELTLEAQEEQLKEANAAFQRGLGHVHDDMYRLPTGFELDRNAVTVTRGEYEPSPSEFKPAHSHVESPVDD